MQINIKENQQIEFKQTWRDEYLKWICGFANAEGGKILVGVNDDGTVCGISDAKRLIEDIPNKVKSALAIVPLVNLLEKDGLEYIEISISPYPFPVSYGGRYYMRSGATNQLLNGQALDAFILKKQGITWDSIPVTQMQSSDIDGLAVRYFVRLATKKGRIDSDIASEETEQLLKKLNLYKNGFWTTAAALLFTENPERYIGGSYVKIAFFENDADILYMDEVHGPLLRQADETIDVIMKKYLKARISYEGIHRIERYPFPEEALREAVLNAIVHKDYSRQIPIQIRVYANKIMIFNDCRLSAYWTDKTLKQSHKSEPYNPNIAHVFYLSGHVESWGRGIDKICKSCSMHGIPLPEYNVQPEEICVTFKTSDEYLNGDKGITDIPKDSQRIPKGVPKEIPESVRRTYDAIVENPRLTIKELSERLEISDRTIKKHIAYLKEENLIERVGGKTHGHWQIKPLL